MGKMNELSAEGVTDLHSYTIGRQDGRQEFADEVIAMVKKVINNPELEIDTMPSKLSLTVLVATIQMMLRDDDDL